MMSTMRDLIERSVSFRYGYNIKCEHCGGATPLSASTYYREQCHSARIKCVHCPCDIRYGPLAMALRDAGDPILDDQVALGAAWYHTSTDSCWPTRGRKMAPAEIAFLRHRVLDDAAERVRERHENQALHLGPTRRRSNRCSARCGMRAWPASGSGSTGSPCAAT